MMIALSLLVLAVVVFVAILEIRKMSAALDRLTSEVAALTTVAASAAALLGTLAEEIRNNVDDSDALNALADQIDANTTELSDAVAANTPAAPAPTEPTPPAEPTA